jgi:hypothetical protein
MSRVSDLVSVSFRVFRGLEVQFRDVFAHETHEKYENFRGKDRQIYEKIFRTFVGLYWKEIRAQPR